MIANQEAIRHLSRFVTNAVVEFAPFQHDAIAHYESLIKNAALVCNRSRCVHVVARHHPHSDAGTLTTTDCRRHLGPDWILDSDNSCVTL